MGSGRGPESIGGAHEPVCGLGVPAGGPRGLGHGAEPDGCGLGSAAGGPVGLGPGSGAEPGGAGVAP